MLVIAVAGTELTPEERDWLQHPAVAGVILFTRNFESLAQLIISHANNAAWKSALIRVMRIVPVDRVSLDHAILFQQRNQADSVLVLFRLGWWVVH